MGISKKDQNPPKKKFKKKTSKKEFKTKNLKQRVQKEIP
ncbi:hypothetical protein HPOKI112_06600 [Helicobacter pylori oki112]|nr:hypothetical protein HPOKI112_06600 [Helicobacter pylori oki112]AHN45660.1 hypothetical protein HPOKI898_06595 [Helicobacter pylori oki898]